MSRLETHLNCPECMNPWAIERMTVITETALPQKSMSQRQRWTVECASHHSYAVKAVRGREYQIVIPDD